MRGSAPAKPDFQSDGIRSVPPPTLVLVHRAAVFVVLASYFFMVFCAARGLLGSFGWSAGALFRVLLATAVMTGFIVWLAPLVELPEIWFVSRLPSRRRRRGLCPTCGYALPAQHADATRCPECGAVDHPPPLWQFDWRSLRRFMLLCVPALFVGVLVGAWWLDRDERAFRREAALHGAPYLRQRAWPADFAQLSCDEEGRFSSSSIVESPPVPNWKPRRMERLREE